MLTQTPQKDTVAVNISLAVCSSAGCRWRRGDCAATPQKRYVITSAILHLCSSSSSAGELSSPLLYTHTHSEANLLCTTVQSVIIHYNGSAINSVCIMFNFCRLCLDCIILSCVLSLPFIIHEVQNNRNTSEYNSVR